MYIWIKNRAAGRVGSDILSAIAGRVGSTFRRVGSGPRKVTRGQLWAGWHGNRTWKVNINLWCNGWWMGRMSDRLRNKPSQILIPGYNLLPIKTIYLMWPTFVWHAFDMYLTCAWHVFDMLLLCDLVSIIFQIKSNIYLLFIEKLFLRDFPIPGVKLPPADRSFRCHFETSWMESASSSYIYRNWIGSRNDTTPVFFKSPGNPISMPQIFVCIKFREKASLCK